MKLKHQLPPLDYDVSALEPFIDARSLHLHHDIHHAAYVNALNRALEAAPYIQDRSAEWLLLNLDEVPIRARSKVRDNAGAHLNHSMFWNSMCPPLADASLENAPAGPVVEAIGRSFGSFANFKFKFEDAGARLLGSGWVWLVHDSSGNGSLQLLTTAGYDNPIKQGYEPLLVIDVWEHAYYLKYQNARDKYLQAWWSVVNWIGVEEKYEKLQRDMASEEYFKR